MPEGGPESESEVEKLRARLVELTKKNQELRWKNEQLERLNRSLLESASWKVTAPLRSFGTFVNRATEKLRSLQSRPSLEDDRRMPGDPELLEPPEALESWPSLTVVSAVYNKARELPFFLEAFARQGYPGELEVIVVDDCSTDTTWKVLEEARAKWRWLRCEKLEKNSGQCRARNLGISLAKGSIVFVMDGDCVTNGRFLERHAKKHVLQDELDIVLGPYNLETGDQDPWAVLAQTENEPARVLSELRMDQRRPESFLNCITRNMSIKRRFLERNGLLSAAYDEAFSYSASGEGYGFEDVEAGYRFYELGARIGFELRAFVLHVTHPPLVAEGKRKLGLARNWKKLLEKHPSLPLVAREWTNRTFLDMKSFLEKSGVDGKEVLDACIPLASVAVLENVPLAPPKKKRLRVLTYRWHCGHQYELWKLPHDFTLARGLTAMCDRWDYRSRPFPENARFQNLEELDLSAFDVGILHFDENSLSPQNSNGQLQPDWGAIFQHLKRNARIPLVAICHGTPQFFGQYDHALERRSLEIRVDEDERKKLVDFLSDVLVICNSHQAAQEWGFKKSRVIWHGFDPSEYPPARRKKGILTVAERIKTRPHYRGYYLYEDVTRDLECEILSPDMPNGVRVQEPSLYARTLNEYGSQWFRSYVDLIRDYSIFFNPTLRSPMPRARGEAMLVGLATVSAKNHDVERFVENGKNGFFATEARELNEQLKFLLKDERRARAIGEAGRETAMRVFHLDRYLAEWQNVLDSVTS